jgi:hypothetical protein
MNRQMEADNAPLPLTFHPVTVERLADLARFSERHGKFRYQPFRLRAPAFRHGGEIRAAARRQHLTIERALAILFA